MLVSANDKSFVAIRQVVRVENVIRTMHRSHVCFGIMVHMRKIKRNSQYTNVIVIIGLIFYWAIRGTVNKSEESVGVIHWQLAT